MRRRGICVGYRCGRSCYDGAFVFILISIPAVKWFQRHYAMPFEEKVKADGKSGNSAESYWKRKDISLKDIAFNAGAAFALVAVSVKISGFLKAFFSSPFDRNAWRSVSDTYVFNCSHHFSFPAFLKGLMDLRSLEPF